jgi:hypothetical protein
MKPIKAFTVSLLLISAFVPAQIIYSYMVPFALITPSVTLSPASTLSKTPLETLTPAPTQTPMVVTVIYTKIITVIPATSTPSRTATFTITPMNTITPTPKMAEEKETGNQSLLSIAVIGMTATFIAGIVVGTLLSSFRKR